MVHKKIDHQFTHKPLSYDAQENYQPYIRLSFFFKKLPEVSYEQFHRHWATVHADLTIASKAFKDCHIGRYVQFHQTPEMKEQAKELGMVGLDYDGCTDFYVKSWDQWIRFTTSEEYLKAMNPDLGNFMAMPIHVMIGHDNLIFGEALKDIGGSDGVLPKDL